MKSETEASSIRYCGCACCGLDCMGVPGEDFCTYCEDAGCDDSGDCQYPEEEEEESDEE